MYIWIRWRSIHSAFLTRGKPSGEDPERFYHGFVLGLMGELCGGAAEKRNQCAADPEVRFCF